MPTTLVTRMPVLHISFLRPPLGLPCPLQARRHVSAMTEVERKINAKLLRDVEASGLGRGARIPAVRSPTVK